MKKLVLFVSVVSMLTSFIARADCEESYFPDPNHIFNSTSLAVAGAICPEGNAYTYEEILNLVEKDLNS